MIIWLENIWALETKMS